MMNRPDRCIPEIFKRVRELSFGKWDPSAHKRSGLSGRIEEIAIREYGLPLEVLYKKEVHRAILAFFKNINSLRNGELVGIILPAGCGGPALEILGEPLYRVILAWKDSEGRVYILYVDTPPLPYTSQSCLVKDPVGEEAVVITHSHPDHYFSTTRLQLASGGGKVPVLVVATCNYMGGRVGKDDFSVHKKHGIRFVILKGDPRNNKRDRPSLAEILYDEAKGSREDLYIDKSIDLGGYIIEIVRPLTFHSPPDRTPLAVCLKDREGRVVSLYIPDGSLFAYDRGVIRCIKREELAKSLNANLVDRIKESMGIAWNYIKSSKFAENAIVVKSAIGAPPLPEPLDEGDKKAILYHGSPYTLPEVLDRIGGRKVTPVVTDPNFEECINLGLLRSYVNSKDPLYRHLEDAEKMYGRDRTLYSIHLDYIRDEIMRSGYKCDNIYAPGINCRWVEFRYSPGTGKVDVKAIGSKGIYKQILDMVLS